MQKTRNARALRFMASASESICPYTPRCNLQPFFCMAITPFPARGMDDFWTPSFASIMPCNTALLSMENVL